jgi:HemY protein
VRVLFWFLLLAAAAVAVALAAKITAGYALFVAPPYRVELSLNLLLVLVVGGFVLGYMLLRIVRRTLGLPE